MFSTSYLQFFIDLASNNNSVWFNANRATYEKMVKQPFAAFVSEMIRRIQQYEPEVQIKPGDAIMRINNDIRFSKDKTPYKLHMCANISEFGKRNLGFPGFFFQLSPENIQIYGGVYMVDNPTLLKIRTYMAAHPDELREAIANQDFVAKFGSIQGETNKRLAPEFAALLPQLPLIANKQFYYGASLPAELILSDNLPETLMEYYRAGRSVSRFFQEAMR